MVLNKTKIKREIERARIFIVNCERANLELRTGQLIIAIKQLLTANVLVSNYILDPTLLATRNYKVLRLFPAAQTNCHRERAPTFASQSPSAPGATSFKSKPIILRPDSTNLKNK